MINKCSNHLFIWLCFWALNLFLLWVLYCFCSSSFKSLAEGPSFSSVSAQGREPWESLSDLCVSTVSSRNCCLYEQLPLAGFCLSVMKSAAVSCLPTVLILLSGPGRMSLLPGPRDSPSSVWTVSVCLSFSGGAYMCLFWFLEVLLCFETPNLCEFSDI